MVIFLRLLRMEYTYIKLIVMQLNPEAFLLSIYVAKLNKCRGINARRSVHRSHMSRHVGKRTVNPRLAPVSGD